MWTVLKWREAQLNFDNDKSNFISCPQLHIKILQAALDVQLFVSKSYFFGGGGGRGGICKSMHGNCMWQLDSGPSLEFNVAWQANRKKHWSKETGVVDCNHDARQGNIYLQTSMVSLVLQSVNII